jgi:hypothetical protein
MRPDAFVKTSFPRAEGHSRRRARQRFDEGNDRALPAGREVSVRGGHTIVFHSAAGVVGTIAKTECGDGVSETE